MNKKLMGAVLLASSAVAACATTSKEEKVEATSEVIYEEEAPAQPSDPFMDCQVQPQQGVAVLQCGNIVGVLATYPGALPEEAVQQNFEQFQAQFPPESKREPFTQQIGGYTASGMRVYEESEVAPFRAELVIVPIDANKTQIISCAVRGTTQFERCAKIVEVLATQGVPSTVPGAEQLQQPAAPTTPGPGTPSTGGADAGTTGTQM